MLFGSCTTSGPRAPSTTGSRSIHGGYSRQLAHEQSRIYSLELTQTLVATGPQIETAPRITTLKVRLRETAFSPEGGVPSVSITVVDAAADGPDAEQEKNAALGRTVGLTFDGDTVKIDFQGRQLGKPGELRAVDAALLAHLLGPMQPRRKLALPGNDEDRPRSDIAKIPAGWSSQDVDLSGSLRVAGTSAYEGLRSSTITTKHDGTAKFDLGVLDDSDPSTPAFDPVVNGFFSSIFRSDPAISSSPLSALFLAPVAAVDVFTFVFACLFTLGSFPGCDDDTGSSGRVTLELSGPITLEQTGTVHRRSGALLTSSGRGSMSVQGRFPEPPAPRAGTRQARAARAASGIAGATLSIRTDWVFNEKLEPPLPEDGLWWLPYGAAALALIALIALVVGSIARRSSRAS